MRNDTDPTGSPSDTDRDTEPNDTDPGGPPAMSGPPRLELRAEAPDSDVASLLGKLAPARVSPAVGDTRETDGHDAAAFRIAARKPPKAHETPTPETPVIIVTPTPAPMPPVVSDAERRAREVSTFAKPRNKRLSTSARVAIGLAFGVFVCVAGVAAGVGYSRRPAAEPSVIATATTTATMPAAATVTPPPPSAAPSEPRAVASAEPAVETATPPISSSAPTTASRPAVAFPRATAARSASPAGSTPALPKDIRWTLE